MFVERGIGMSFELSPGEDHAPDIGAGHGYDPDSATNTPLQGLKPGLDLPVLLGELQDRVWSTAVYFDQISDSATPFDKVPLVLRDKLAGIFTPFVAEGTDFGTAIGVLRAWSAQERAMLRDDHALTLDRERDDRIHELNLRALEASLNKLEKIFDVFNLADAKTRRAEVLQTISPELLRCTGLDIDYTNLMKLLLVDTAAGMSARTLNVRPMVEPLKNLALYPSILFFAGKFAEATDPHPMAGYSTLPFERPEQVAQARRSVMEAIWNTAGGHLRRQHDHQFYQGFTALAAFGSEAVPWFRKYFQMLNSQQLEMDVKLVTACLLTLARLGPQVYSPFIVRTPMARGEIRGEPTSIIEDFLLLTQHPDERMQKLAFKILVLIARDDVRVHAKFERLLRQVNDFEDEDEATRACIFSMNPLEAVLRHALIDPSVTIPPRASVQATAVRELVKRLQSGDTDPRIPRALDELEQRGSEVPLPVRRALGERHIPPPVPVRRQQQG